jgi:hypothetical protein
MKDNKEPVVTPDEVIESTPKKEIKTYENSHLVMYCGKCNSRYILEENIPSNRGITINLPPTSDAEFILVCKDCGNKMGIFYVEATKKDTETTEVKKDEVTESVRKTNKKK